MRSLVVGAFVLGTGLLLGSPADAVQIFVCQPSATQPCTSAPGGTAIGHESNLITTPGAFDIGLEGGGFVGTSPLLVGIALPNGVGASTASISFGSVPSEPLASIGTYGLTHNTVTGFNSGTVFSAVGLDAGGSVSFSNLQGIDNQNGFGSPTNFTLEVFAVPTVLRSMTPITIDTTAPAGSFIFAYDCAADSATSSGCSGGGNNLFETVNTNIGLIATTTPPRVPEPASLAIFGAALAGLGLVRRRRKNKL